MFSHGANKLVPEFENYSDEFRKNIKSYLEISKHKLQFGELSAEESLEFINRVKNLNSNYSVKLKESIEDTFKCHLNDELSLNSKNSSVTTIKEIDVLNKNFSKKKNYMKKLPKYLKSKKSPASSIASLASVVSTINGKELLKYNSIDPPFTIQELQTKSLFTYLAASNKLKNDFYCYDANSKTLKEYNGIGHVVHPVKIFHIDFKKFGPFCENSEKTFCFTDCKNTLIVIDSEQIITRRQDVKALISDVAFDDIVSDHLYISDTNSDSVYLWNLKLTKLNESPIEISRFTLGRPFNLFAHEKYLIVTGSPEVEYRDIRHNEISQIKSTNCIYIIEKENTNKKKMIEFDDWFQPTGLNVDDYSHIYTIAYKLGPNKAILHVSLFILSFSGQKLKELPIDNLVSFKYVLILNNKIIFSDDERSKGLKTCSLRYSNNLNKKNTSIISLTDKKSSQSILSNLSYLSVN